MRVVPTGYAAHRRNGLGEARGRTATGFVRCAPGMVRD